MVIWARYMLNAKDFQSIYNDIAGKLTNYLVANGQSYATACDIVQESFMRVWNMRAQLAEDSSISGLVFTIARNLRTDYARRNKRMVYQDEIKDGELTSEAVTPAADDMAYLRHKLQKALDSLPDDLRQAYTLFQVAGMSVRDIAFQEGITESLVKVRVYRARQRLQVLLQDLKDEF